MRYQDVARELRNGKTVTFRPTGQSMTPIIKSRQQVVVRPFDVFHDTITKGDVVLCHVGGRHIMHKVTAIRDGSYQISNNHGHVNGWTRKIYGKVVEIDGRPFRDKARST